jgi:hypothetical protein
MPWTKQIAAIALCILWPKLAFSLSLVDRQDENDAKNKELIGNFTLPSISSAISQDLILDHIHTKRPVHSFFGLNYINETVEDEQTGFLSYATNGADYFAGIRVPHNSKAFSYTLVAHYESLQSDIKERNLVEAIDFTFSSRQTMERRGIDLGGSVALGSSAYALNLKLKARWVKERYSSLVYDRHGKMQYVDGGINVTRIWEHGQLSLGYQPRLVARATNISIRSAPTTVLSYLYTSGRWTFVASTNYLELSQVYSQTTDTVRGQLAGFYQPHAKLRWGLGVNYQPRAFKHALTASKYAMETYGGSAHLDLLAYHDASISLSYDVKVTDFEDEQRRLNRLSQDISIFFEKTL